MPLEHERSYLPLVRSPLVQQEKDGDTAGDLEENRHDSSSNSNTTISFKPPAAVRTHDPESPQFRHFDQSTNLELFYDLFFVANLTVFTYEHEVNDGESLKQYVGFFCIIWFTWYQVSLYDVRFFMDSVFERVCMAVQFLVMIGFAIVGPEFNPGEETRDDDDESPSLVYFKALTLVLMVSRLILVVQYLQAMWFARNYKKVVVPMSLIIGTYFIAAMVYLGLFWTFHLDSDGENHTYIVWYVIAVLETVLVTMVSVMWRNLSFTGTHLVERMSLLTLIILGEGAIGIARACQYIVYDDNKFDFVGSVAAAIVCAVFNLYFMYMIYFDWIHEDLFGTIRQQIWSFLHFPLHVALVLAVEGASQCITWTAAIRRNSALLDEFKHWNSILGNFTDPSIPPSSFQEAAAALNETALALLDLSLSRSSELLATAEGIGYYYQTNASAIPTLARGATDPTAAGNAFDWLVGILFNTVFKIAGFLPPSTNAETSETLDYLKSPLDFSEFPHEFWREQSEANITKAWTVFTVTYVYFYVTTGAFLVLCTVLAWVNRGRRTGVFVARLAVTSVVGLGVGLLATMDATETVGEFVLSAWLLPTVTLCLFFVVVMNAVKLSPRVPRMPWERRKG